MEVEREEEGGVGGWKAEETHRDKSKRGEARPLHNNMDDLTLLHCSNSCLLQISAAGEQTSAVITASTVW